MDNNDNKVLGKRQMGPFNVVAIVLVLIIGGVLLIFMFNRMFNQDDGQDEKKKQSEASGQEWKLDVYKEISSDYYKELVSDEEMEFIRNVVKIIVSDDGRIYNYKQFENEMPRLLEPSNEKELVFALVMEYQGKGALTKTPVSKEQDERCSNVLCNAYDISDVKDLTKKIFNISDYSFSNEKFVMGTLKDKYLVNRSLTEEYVVPAIFSTSRITMGKSKSDNSINYIVRYRMNVNDDERMMVFNFQKNSEGNYYLRFLYI